MKLTLNDKKILKTKYKYTDKEILQIEKAAEKTVYKINFKEKISVQKAIKLLGRENFLSGIGRSTFHWSSVREIKNSDDVVEFDSSAFFKE